MSRIGRKPIEIPDGVEIDVKPGAVSVKGPKGELNQHVDTDMKVAIDDGTLTVERPTDRGEHRALHGLTRSLIANMVEGVTDGFERRLEIQGVGYRANLKGKSLEMALGYSHPVTIEAPEGIEFEVPQPTEVVVRGIDKQLVGETAARIRKTRPPEPYKGKGVPLRRRARRPQGREEGLMTVLTKPQKRLRRRRRVRARIRGNAERPRLSVYRSNRGVFAQLIDDDAGRTVAVRLLDRGRSSASSARWSRPSASGELLAERGEGRRRRDLRLRPRWLPLPRPRRRDRRGRPRGRPEVLMAAKTNPLPSSVRWL